MVTDEIQDLYKAIKEEAAKATETAQEGNTQMETLHYMRFCSLYMQVLDAKMDEVYEAVTMPYLAATMSRGPSKAQ